MFVGLDTAHVARIANTLMARLGLPNYLVYGGDWGCSIARQAAQMYPEK